MKLSSSHQRTLPSPKSVARTWHCSRCDTKLGTWSGRNLIVKQGDAVYRFRDIASEAEAICRRCGLMNRRKPSV